MVKLTATFATLLAGASAVFGASLQQVTNFGTNPTNVKMFIYVPDRIANSQNAPVLVAAHYCTGTAQAYFNGTPYKGLADQHGFIVIYPSAPDSGGCWDVHTQATLTHNGGGDSRGIASMVTYTLDKYKANPNRVYVTGSSSGAMMTQVLMGAYPDLFKGGASFAGVPYGCFAGSGMWNSQCASGQQSRTAKAWGDMVRNAYPGYTGPRPKVAIYHGTNDETLNYNNHKEAIKQWTNVFGYSETPQSTQPNSPVSGMTRSIYGPQFQAISAQGVTHNLPIQGNDVINWFQLNVANPTTSVPVPTTPPSTTSISTPPVSTPTGGTVAKWGQCGGIGYTGPTQCVSGSTCVKVNDWYSQCQ